MAKTTQTEPDIGITKKDRKTVCTHLSNILADQHVLYIKTRNFHWNLIGGRFHSLHEFFEEQYTDLAKAIDETAERIRMIGGVAPGSMAEFLKTSSLKEEPGALLEGNTAISKLLSDHEKASKAIRTSIQKIEDETSDVGSADFLTALLQKHEMTAWMLRSYLDSK